VFGLLRTADAMTPTLTGPQVLATLIGYVLVYAFIFAFGIRYIYALLREGPTETGLRHAPTTGKRPMMARNGHRNRRCGGVRRRCGSYTFGRP